ncbi:cupin domain-containing protein [Streptoalloteichus hindustanus]|uniref:Cupin domain-containing protein n=1 Tax=Streptoalloteichus hindustanus TaxID=2017 RepID=A0A1M4XZC6_STRHI|nr:cupin domain-containing protein [Streptoalloteichus hindustanus]SHE98927.1 Cupin domain-containing protein [Streptoalloteichus hindustanus]
MTSLPAAFAQLPEDGERLRAPAGEYVVRLPGSATGGALSIVEFRFPPGALGAAPHVHHGHEEYFYVLDGEVTFDVDRGARTVGAGGAVAVPRGVAHGFRNEGTAWARCLFVLTPAGYEDYFRAIDRALTHGEELTGDRLAALRARFATETL